jgi:dTDP-4-amino-4,6-dideoxygalactose transaminase
VVLATGWYILGNEVKESETSFASIVGQYCIGTGNGLDALVLIFKAYIQLGNYKRG